MAIACLIYEHAQLPYTEYPYFKTRYINIVASTSGYVESVHPEMVHKWVVRQDTIRHCVSEWPNLFVCRKIPFSESVHIDKVVY